MTALLAIEGVSKRFRGLRAVDRVSCEILPGQIFAVIGPNRSARAAAGGWPLLRVFGQPQALANLGG